MYQVRPLFSRLVLITLGPRAFPRRAEGQSLVEYGLIIALIAVIVLVVVTTLGGKLKIVFSSVANSL